MTLFIHIGPSKTASSLGQQIFGSATATADVEYPLEGRLAQRPVHHLLARYRPSQDHSEEARARSGLDDILARLERRSILLSSEDFSLDLAHHEELFGRARALGHNIVAIFVLRDPITRMNSIYGQVVKTFKYAGAFPEWLSESALDTKLLAHSWFMKPWQDAGIEVWMYPYSTNGMTEVYLDICRRVGLSDPKPLKSIVNPGLSAAANKVCLTYGPAVRAQDFMVFMNRLDREMGLAPFFGFSEADIAATLERLRPELEPLPVLMPQPHTAYPARNVEVPDAEFNDYRDRLFEMISKRNPDWSRPEAGLASAPDA